MKKISILPAWIVLVLAVGISCSKPGDPADPQMPGAIMEPVIFNFTGTWNGTSGQILKPALDSIRQFYPGTILINAHINQSGNPNSDPLSNSDSEGLARFFNVYSSSDSTYSIPYSWFIVDGFIGGFNYSGISYSAFATSIDWAKEMKTPAIALDIIPRVSGNQLDLTVRTEAVYAFSMPVYISVYLTEDNVYATQTNDASSGPGVHHDVLRDCLNAFNGDKIADNLAAGAKGEFHYSSILDEGWNQENMKVNVTVWYQDPIYGNLVHLGKRVALLD
jgi:hypothetical protein